MNQQPLARPGFPHSPYCSLVAFGCLLALAGCQSGTAGGNWFTWKNPFTSSAPTAPARDLAKAAEVDQSRRQMPMLRTEATLPHQETKVAAHDGGKQHEGNAIAHDTKRIDAAKPKPDLATDFAQEMTRARNLERSGKFAEARVVYERLITRYPKRYESYHRLGVVADRERRFSEAQALFSEAIRLNPANPDLHNDLGYCLYLQGQYDKAEAAVAHAIQVRPANPRYHNNLGMIYGRQRRDGEALEQFRRGGSEADAYYNLAFVQAAREDTEGAKKYFRLALRADPGYDQARQALDTLERTADRRQAPNDSATAQNGTSGQEPKPAAQSPARYETQPVSLTVPTAPPIGGQQHDSVLLR